MMVLPLSDKHKQMHRYQRVTSFVLLAGIFSFFTGFFWQESYSRLHTVYFILVVLPSLLLIPVFIKEQLHKNKLFILIFIFFIYSLLTVFWGDDYQADLLVKYLKRVAVLLVLFYAINHILLHYPSSEKILFVLLMMGGGVLASYSMLVYFQKGLYLEDEIVSRLKLWGGLNDPISSAMVFGALFLLSARAYLIEKNKYLLMLYLLLSLIFVVEILLTKSRGPLLALLLSTPLLFFIIKPLGYRRVFYPLFLLVMLFLALALFSDFFDIVFSRLSIASSRDVIWRDSINLSLEKPWFGYGLGSEFKFFVPYTDSYVTHSHNFILSTWLYAGIPGVVLVAAIIYYALKICFLHRKEDFSILGVVLIFGVFCLLINSAYPVSRANERWFIFWIPLAFIAAHSLASSSYNRKQRSPAL